MLKSKRISKFSKRKSALRWTSNTDTYINISESELFLSTLSLSLPLQSPAHPLISNSVVYYLVYFARKRLYNSNENFCGNATITFLPNIILLCTAVAVRMHERKKKDWKGITCMCIVYAVWLCCVHSFVLCICVWISLFLWTSKYDSKLNSEIIELFELKTKQK